MFDCSCVSMDFGVLKAFVAPDEEGIVRPARARRHRNALYHPRVTRCCAVSLDIPEGIHTIGEGALERCFALTGVAIPESVELIGVRAFRCCNNLKEITLPSHLTAIWKEAFAYCTGLTRICIPDSVKTIGESAFAGCTKLQEICLPKHLCDKVSVIFGEDVEVRMFSAVYSGKLQVNPDLAVSLENAVKRRWDSAVDELIASDDCEKMKQYLALWKDRPVAVERLDEAIERSVRSKTADITAFLMEYKKRYYSPALLEEMRQRELEKALGRNTVADWRKLFRYRAEEDGLVITWYKGKDPVIEVPAMIGRKPVIAIEQWVPDMDGGPDEPYQIVLSKGLREIRERAFEDCDSLTDINIPDTVTEIGAGAFACCSALEEIDLPEGITCIQPDVFVNCLALSSVMIPESVTSISWDAFYGCDSLQEVELPTHVSRIDTSRCTEEHFPETIVVVPKGSLTEQTIRNTSIPYRTV